MFGRMKIAIKMNEINFDSKQKMKSQKLIEKSKSKFHFEIN